jgi:hypothetical protein
MAAWPEPMLPIPMTPMRKGDDEFMAIKNPYALKKRKKAQP